MLSDHLYGLSLIASRPESDVGNRPANVRALAVSVVIPTHGRHASLARCLGALAEQTLPRERFEVIVSDDGSATPVASTVDRFADRMTVSVVRRARGGPAAARNEGARQARGQFVAFTDDDCVPAPSWLETLSDRIHQSPGSLIGGSIVNLLPDDPYATATQLIMNCVYDYYARTASEHRFFSTSNLAVPTDRFWLLDGFSERYRRAAGEDYDFCARWSEAGFPNEYAPEVEVGHAHGHTLRSFWRQHYGYGRALLRVREGMARRNGRSGIDLESPGFYRQILTYPLKHSADGRGVRNAALVFLAQIATATGGLREWLVPAGRSVAPAATDERRTPQATSITH